MMSAIMRIVLLILVTNLIACQIREERWTKDASFSNTGIETSKGTSVATRSRIECAIACSSVGGCRSFKFGSSSGICYMSPNEPEWFSRSNTKAGCPTGKGYESFRNDVIDMSVCLKIDTTERNRLSAEQACRDDGGHLVIFESKAMHTWIVVLLNGELSGNSPPDVLWFDGEDRNADGIVYSSHTGELASWYEWKYSQPDEFFIKGHANQGYLFRDYAADDEHASLCQIDME